MGRVVSEVGIVLVYLRLGFDFFFWVGVSLVLGDSFGFFMLIRILVGG